MRSSLSLCSLLLIAACGSGNSHDDAAVSLMDASTFDASGVPTDGGVDAAVVLDASGDAGALTFCQEAGNAAAAFCADFENTTEVALGWDTSTATGSGSLALDPLSIGSAQCARARVAGVTAGKALLRTTVNAGAAKSKVVVDLDAYLSTTGWTASSSNTFIMLELRTGTSANQYFIEIERNTDWVFLLTGDSEKMFPSISEMAWHHIRISYDGSGATGDILLTVDGSNVKALSQPKGSPPAGAPATFDNIVLELGAASGATAASTTFYVDNVVVRYP